MYITRHYTFMLLLLLDSLEGNILAFLPVNLAPVITKQNQQLHTGVTRAYVSEHSTNGSAQAHNTQVRLG